ncbi:MAG: cupredoxin family copper-binding protein [Acidimicrobiia bacterium]|nr:cupredoxin family copper-binding protein [Acidimicrobiia bacterium]
MLPRRTLIAAIALVFAACASASDATAPTAGQAGTTTAVSIDSFAYMPQTITVAVGETVEWTNDQSVGHTVTADDGSIDSGTMANQATFAMTFETAGTFAYHCTIHPNMTGTVTVTG